MTGFKTLRRAGVTLSSGQTLAIPLALEIGAIAEEITVTGEAPLLEVTTLRQGLVLDEKKIRSYRSSRTCRCSSIEAPPTGAPRR